MFPSSGKNLPPKNHYIRVPFLAQICKRCVSLAIPLLGNSWFLEVYFSFSWICFQGFYARVPHQKVWQSSRPCHRTVRKGGWGQSFINCTQPTSILIVIIPRTRTRKASSTASSNQCSRLWRKGEDGVWLYNHFMMITISLYYDVLQCIVEISY